MDATLNSRLGRMRETLPKRLAAAGIHLSLSGVIFGVALYLILFHWYPGFHFGVDGGWQGVRIMVAVDLVLGPALTLVIFNPRKARRLIVFDLCCIGLAQLAALVWGFHAVHGQRPVSINYHEGIFYSMPGRSLGLDPGGVEALARLSDRQPALVYVAQPTSEEERRRVFDRMQRGRMVHEDPYFFRALAPHWAEVLGSAVDPAANRESAFQRELAGFLQARGGTVGDYRLFRYQGGYGSCYIVFSASGEPLDALACEAQ